MSQKILVTYATRFGSTGEIANRIANILRETGLEVEVLPVQQVKELDAYRAVVLGSAVRMGKPLEEAIEFARKHSDEMAQKPVAYFISGATMKRDTPDNRLEAARHAAPLQKAHEAGSLGLFAGKVDYTKIPPFWRLLGQLDQSGFMAEGDFRDWEAIDAWARSLATELMK